MTLKPLALSLLLLAGATSAPVDAAQSACPENYAQGELPAITNSKLASSALELCNPGYAVVYSGIARAPLWSAEHLSPGRIAQAKGQKRANNFREDTRLPADYRARLSDFRGSGYDRGHMAPAGDMPNPAADSTSFLLSNIVAQDSQQNRNQWAAIESAVRALAAHREIFVLTGPLWLGANIQRLHGRVMVPTHTYKVVYDPQTHAGAAYVVENLPNKRYQAVSIEALGRASGVRFFAPGMVRSELKLPKPRY
jgi:endonuclease G